MVFNGIFIKQVFMVMFILIIKRKKNIAVIINASNSSSDFYFGHFVGAEDSPQSYMLSFSPQNQILGF